MEVKRAEVLQKLENAAVAITGKAILEQSNTFVFQAGELVTFNGEVLTRQPSPFGNEIEGSIIASNLLMTMQRFPDDTLQIRQRDGELRIKGKRRESGIKMMAEVLLPYDDVPVPEKFRKMPDNLPGFLVQAARVCGKDETAPKTTHVHITKDRVESTDSYRAFRAKIETNLPRPILVHAMNLIDACKFDIKKMSVSKADWFHVRTSDGMVISLICSADKYYKPKLLNGLFDIEGEEVTLPSNLSEILSRAEVMDTPNLSIDGWDSQVTIYLSENLIRITSQKEEGWFRESKKVKYEGPDMSFTIHPTFLKELVEQTRKVILNKRQIKISTRNIEFTATLKLSGNE